MDELIKSWRYGASKETIDEFVNKVLADVIKKDSFNVDDYETETINTCIKTSFPYQDAKSCGGKIERFEYTEIMNWLFEEVWRVLAESWNSVGFDAKPTLDVNKKSRTIQINPQLHRKRCSKCKETKDYSCFGLNRRTKDGRQTWCKDCIKEYDKNKKEKTRKIQPQAETEETVKHSRMLNIGIECLLCGKVTRYKGKLQGTILDDIISTLEMENVIIGNVRGVCCGECYTKIREK